jgi:ribosomal protein L6P/L9E
MANFKVLYDQLSTFYFLKLSLKGLGYRLFKITNDLYQFYFTMTNFLYFHVPEDVIFKVKVRQILLISHNYQLVRMVMVHLLLLKRLTVYRLRGIFYPRQIITLKPGKKAF